MNLDSLINLIYYPEDPYKTLCAVVVMTLAIEFMSLITSYLGKMGRR